MICPDCHADMSLVAVANPLHVRAKKGRREVWWCPECGTTHYGAFAADPPKPKSKPPAEHWWADR